MYEFSSVGIETRLYADAVAVNKKNGNGNEWKSEKSSSLTA